MTDATLPMLRRSDLVPLSERVRGLLWLRCAVAATIVGVVSLRPAVVRIEVPLVVAVVLGHLAVISVAGWMMSRPRSPVRAPIGGLLVADCALVVLAALVWGDPTSPLRYLLVVQAVAASLLASFRTGLRVAVGQTLLVACAVSAGPRSMLGLAPLALDHGARLEVAALLLTCWVAALASAAMAAANERELRRRRYDLEALARLSAALEHQTDPAAVARTFVDAAVNELGLARAAVLAPRGNGWVVLGEDGPDGTTVAGSELVQDVAASSTAVLLRRTPGGDDGIEPLLPGARHVVLLPLPTHRGTGVVLAEHDWRRGSRLEARVLTMLERYRDHLGLRLSNAWLVTSLWVEATTDRLTGVTNRRRFEAMLTDALATASPAAGFCLALVDVDHFKKVNDTYGHAAGDEVLRAVARCFATSLRAGDVVARFGGEEFVVLLRDADLAAAQARVEALRSALPAATQPYGVTASFGVTACAPGVDSADSLLRRADDAMYAAKASGRDRVVGVPGPIAGVTARTRS